MKRRNYVVYCKDSTINDFEKQFDVVNFKRMKKTSKGC